MGYAAEKKKADRKWSKAKTIVVIVVACVVLVAAILSVFLPAWSWKYRVSLPKVERGEDGELRIHFIDVGQGDATLIELPDGKIALIDGGDDTKETEYAIMRYLYALDIETIDYLILTHADEDHCGALDTVVENVAVKQAYLPLQSATVNTQYAELYTALLENEIAYVYAHNGVDMSGEGYTFTFLHPFAYDVTNALEANKNFDTASNEYSAVVWLEYNGVGSLFTGDLPASQERVLAQAYSIGAVNAELAKTEILKVGHHGSQNSTSQELLSVIPNLKTAIISCGENAYGHPHEEVLERLTKTDVYRTDEDGSVFISIKKDEQTYSVTTLGK